MAEKRDFRYPSVDGKTEIRVREWSGDGEVTAVVQLIHGIAEHIERYDDFAAYLAEHGIVVVGNDLPGHGESVTGKDELGYFAENDGWFSALEDVHTLHRLTAERYPNKPYFMLGHSMGSFFLRTYMTEYPDGLAGAVISGTGYTPAAALSLGSAIAAALMKKNPRVKSELLRKLCFGGYNKRVPHPQNANEWLSRDPDVSAEYTADERCGFLPSAGMYREMFRGIAYIQKKENIARVPQDLPLLFVSGTEDPVGNYTKGAIQSRDGYANAGCRDIEMKFYEGGRHEMLNEINKEQVWRDILAWMKEKTEKAE